MARYDYQCPECGEVFEVEHPMGEHPEVSCPSCGHAAERVFSASGIVFKGSGYYNTDQRGGGSSTSATSSGTDKGGALAKTEKPGKLAKAAKK